jgi:hypothetical protein
MDFNGTIIAIQSNRAVNMEPYAPFYTIDYFRWILFRGTVASDGCERNTGIAYL